MKIIHCSLWGDIEVSDLAISIIDTVTFQRLHYIKQNGFAYKVFPTATTTRFSHSIGVYHITKCFLDFIRMKQPECPIQDTTAELICIAGLCHDLGHGPYSHWFDQFIDTLYGDDDDKPGWAYHEKRSTDILRYIVAENRIEMTPDQVDFVCSMIEENPDQWYTRIINNQCTGIDMDKIDYLLRDSHSFGLKMLFDPMRIIRNSRIIDNDWCFCERIRDEIVTLFHIRNKMYKDIYFHPTIQKFDQCAIQLVHRDTEFVEKVKSIIENKKIIGFQKLTDGFILEMDLFSEMEKRNWSSFTFQPLMIFNDKQIRLIDNVKFYKRKTPNETI
jgi:HD superfamily phosphohydrolase